MTEEIITLLSLDDAGAASVIKTKLETQGITCFMNKKTHPIPRKIMEQRNIDIRVYLKDLDKALLLIAEE